MTDPITHFDAGGAAHVVSIDDKPETPRRAVAEACVHMAAETFDRIARGAVGKGDVLAVARVAAISATKTTAQTIPLCHPVRITAVQVEFELVPVPPSVRVRVDVHAHDRTGPDMEAMHAATVGALTIYDMCKAMDRAMRIDAVRLLEKSGGRTGTWRREP
jgi:cyclic pyranopterin monophosphate synthase